MKFNQLTVLEEVKHKGRLMYRTQCDCGRMDIKRKDWVTSGRTKSCKSCASKITAMKYPPPINRKGCEGISGTHYLHIKTGALRRNIKFDITPEFLWELFLAQDKKCALTGVSLLLEPAIRNQNVDWKLITASLDRKDSSKAYTNDNVWWVHKTVNRLKNNYSLDELLFWSNLIIQKHGNPEPSSVNEIEVAEKVQRLDGEDSTNKPSKSAQPLNIKGEDIV